MRDAERQALAQIGETYQRCQLAGEQLEQAIDEASVHGASPPIDALHTDFAAQLAVTRSVCEFAALCADQEPDLDGVPGAAFVLAMYQAGAGLPPEELENLTRSVHAWLVDVSRWTPAQVSMPPPRPVSPAHSHVLATVGEWWDFHHERMHDEVVAMLATATGQTPATAIGVGAGGEVITVTSFKLRTAWRPNGLVHRVLQRVKNFRR